MPELPEVENVCRQLNRRLAGVRISRLEILWRGVIKSSPGFDEHSLAGKVIYRVLRVGKLVLFDLGGQSLLLHLKMTGQPLIRNNRAFDSRCRFILAGKTAAGRPIYLHFNDTRKFGRLYLADPDNPETMKPLLCLGPDALAVTHRQLAAICSGRRIPIKKLLLEQSAVAGIGNIYADEILHQAGLHPLTPAGTLDNKSLGSLHSAVKKILIRAIAAGGSSVRDYIQPGGKRGSFQKEHAVYRRQGQPCPRCGAIIARIVIGGRGSCFCPGCQTPQI